MGYNDQAPGFRKCSTAENPSDTLRATATSRARAKAKATMARPTRAKSLLIDYSKTPAPPQELERFNDLVAAMNPSNHEGRRDHEPSLSPSNDPQELQDSSAQHCSEQPEQDDTQHDEYCLKRRFSSRQSLASTTDSCSTGTATASLLDQLPWQQHQDDDSNHDINNNHNCNLSSASIGLPELAPIVPLAGRTADDSSIITSTVTTAAKKSSDRMNSNSDSNLEDSTLNAYYDKSCVSLVGSLPQLDLTSPFQCPVSSSTGARFSRRALLAPTRRYQSLSSLSEHHQVPTNHDHDNVLSFSLRRRGSERNATSTNNTSRQQAKGINRSNTWDYNHNDNNHINNHGETMNGAGISSRERFHNSLTNLNMNISNHDLGVSMADLNTNNTHNTNTNTNASNNMDNSSHHHQAQEQTPIQRRRARLVRHSSVSALNMYQSSITTPSLQPLPQIHAARSLSTSLQSQHPHTPLMITTHQSSVFPPAARRRSTNHPMSGGSSNNNEKQPLLNLPQTIEVTPRSIPTRRSSTRRQPSSANMVMRSNSHHGAAASSTRRRSSTDTGTSAESNSSGGSSKENRRHHELMLSASSHSYFPTTATAAMTTSRERKQATLLATLASKHSCTNAIKMITATTTATTTATATTTGNRRDMLTRSLSSRRHLGRTNIMKNTNTKRRGSLHAHLVSTGAIVAGGNGNNKTNNAAMMAGLGGAKSVGAGSLHTADQSSSMMDNDSSQFVTGSRIRRRMSSRDLFL